MKKIISLILCLLLLLSSVCMTAFADDNYDFFATRQAINKYTGEVAAELVIPNEIDGIVVESILSSAYSKLENVETVVLPNHLMAIWERNFNEFPLLKSVELPETLQAVGGSVFYKCPGLTEIVLPSRLTFIDEYSFARNENLKSIRFTGMAPLYVHKEALLNNHADCVVYVPDDQLEAYTAVLPAGLNIQPSGENAIVYDFTAAEDQFTIDANGVITAATCRTPRVDIPATIGGVTVTGIGNEAFKENLYAFCIVLPEDVTTIGTSAFSGISKLGYVDLPDSVTTIGDSVFYGLAAQTVEFPTQLQTIGEKAFAYARMLRVELPEGLTSVGVSAFQKSRAKEIVLPSTLTTIGDKAFSENEYITTITIPASVTSIGAGAFDESDRLEEVIIECDASIVPADAFANCKNLEMITVPAGTDSAVVDALAAATGVEVKVSGAVEATAAPTAEPTAEPTPEPTAEPTPEPTAEAIYAGSPFVGTWRCHVYEDGTLVLNADGTGLYTPDNPSYSPENKEWTVNDDGTISFADSWWGGYAVVLREDGTMVIGNEWWIFTREGGEATAETPVEAPVAAADASGVVGKWIATGAEMDGMKMDKAMLESFSLTVELVVNEDGTASLGMGGEVEDGLTWTAAEAGITLSIDGDSMTATYNDEGGLTMDFDGAYMFLVKEGAESSDAAPVETPTEAPAAEATPVAAYMGEWTDGYGQNLLFTEDGKCMVNGEIEWNWEAANGEFKMTWGNYIGEVVTIDADGTMSIGGFKTYYRPGAEVPSNVPATVVGSVEDFVGTWNASVMEMEGMSMNVADMGMVMDLTITADGKITMFDGESTDEGTWTLADGVLDIMGEMQLTLTEDGRLCMAEDGAAMYFVRGEAGTSAPVETPDTAEVDTSALIGTWFDGDTTNFTINEDGTCVATDQYGDSMMEWEVVDGVPMITTGFWCDSPMILNEDGTLYVSDGWSVEKTFTFGAGEIRVGSTIAEPTGTIAASSEEEFYGEWIGETMVMESGTFALADMMMTMNLTINADGTMALFDGAMTDTASWTFAEGYLTAMDGMVEIALMEDGRLCMAQEFNILYLTRADGGSAPVETPVESAVDTAVIAVDSADAFVGIWNASEMDMDGMIMNVADMGMIMDLTINADGTISMFDGETTDETTWTLVDGKLDVAGQMALTMTEDGRLCMEEDGVALYFVKGDGLSAAPVETPVETIVDPAVLAESPVVGEWTDGAGTTLTINGDGTFIATDKYGDMNMAWAIENGVPTITEGYWFGAPMILNEDGTLYISDGIMIDATFTKGAASEAPAEAPALTAEAVAGAWSDGSHTIVLNADGTGVHTFPNGDVSNGTWEINETGCILTGFWMSQYTAIPEADGTLIVTDGGFNKYTMTRAETADAPAVDITPAAGEYDGYVGTWKACYLSTSGLTGDLRSMGITSTLILNADGTGSIDFPTPETGSWYVEDGYMRFGENGMPMTLLDGGFLKFGSDLAGYVVFSQDENAVWDPSMDAPAAPVEPEVPVVEPAAPAAPVAAGDVDMTTLMNRKYVAKTYTAYGQTMDASTLGAEYSLLFRENGTCDFGMAGMVVPNLPWGLQKVAVGLTEVDAFVINYYGTMFNAVLTEAGFDMDFYGTMTLHFVPAE